ncbi:translocator protein PopB, partial [Vibrio parahaemolyticus]|nr:translocator protein PopB [Vibrio parahaemolyticus]
MSSIALDRTQTQVYIPESGQTTLENVQKTVSTATPSVTVENVKSRDADTLNTGRVKVQLDAPNAAVSDKVTDLTLKAMAQLQKIVDTIAKALHA